MAAVTSRSASMSGPNAALMRLGSGNGEAAAHRRPAVATRPGPGGLTGRAGLHRVRVHAVVALAHTVLEPARLVCRGQFGQRAIVDNRGLLVAGPGKCFSFRVRLHSCYPVPRDY